MIVGDGVNIREKFFFVDNKVEIDGIKIILNFLKEKRVFERKILVCSPGEGTISLGDILKNYCENVSVLSSCFGWEGVLKCMEQTMDASLYRESVVFLRVSDFVCAGVDKSVERGMLPNLYKVLSEFERSRKRNFIMIVDGEFYHVNLFKRIFTHTIKIEKDSMFLLRITQQANRREPERSTTLQIEGLCNKVIYKQKAKEVAEEITKQVPYVLPDGLKILSLGQNRVVGRKEEGVIRYVPDELDDDEEIEDD